MCKTSTAKRPFFVAFPLSSQLFDDERTFHEEEITFAWHNGMSWQVRQRSSDCFADEIVSHYPSQINREKVLEVSTASHNYEVGQALSSLNLMYRSEKTGESYSVENWFQSSKVFIDSHKVLCGPYRELLTASKPKRYLNSNLAPGIASQYENDPLFSHIQSEIKNTSLDHFEMEDEQFPLIPRSGFYDYLYAKALFQDSRLSEAILRYDVFTEIMFNPGSGKKRKYNTQARSCAIFVGLHHKQRLEAALKSFDSFCREVGYEGEAADSL